jgi:hypothetical protein
MISAPRKEERQHGDRAREDRQHRVAQHVPEQHHRLGEALRARGAHVVLADLLEEHRPVEERLAAEPRHDADQHRQREKDDRSQPPANPEIGTSFRTPAEQELPQQDVEQRRDRHQEDRPGEPPELEIRVAEEHHQQREGDHDDDAQE